MTTQRCSGRRSRKPFRAQDQRADDGDVECVPDEAVDEGRLVRARPVKNGARQPASEGHAAQRGHQHRADARADIGGGEILAHDQRVGRDDAALRQAEQGRIALGGLKDRRCEFRI